MINCAVAVKLFCFCIIWMTIYYTCFLIISFGLNMSSYFFLISFWPTWVYIMIKSVYAKFFSTSSWNSVTWGAWSWSGRRWRRGIGESRGRGCRRRRRTGMRGCRRGVARSPGPVNYKNGMA
jgi:hypothetical protein